jgi:hypothetical protein
MTKAWFIWGLLASGDEGVLPVQFDNLQDCLKHEATVTMLVEESKCFFGTMRAK